LRQLTEVSIHGDVVRSCVKARCIVAACELALTEAGEAYMAIKEGWVGRFYEDFEVGDVYRCRIGRTITQADNIWFSLLTNNTNQIHFNDHYAARTEFGRTLVNSALTIAIVAGLGVADTSENGFALGWDKIDLPNPLFEGDTIYSESSVLETRESKSRPQWGIVKIRTRGIKQDGTVVIDYSRSVMVWKKEFAPNNDTIP
jgi:itaconyl-CoA hydratase